MPKDFIEGTPVVTITLDKPREFALTLGTRQRLREQLGAEEIDEQRPEQLAVLLWACLGKEGRQEISPEDIADMIHLDNMEAIAAAVRRLRKVSDPDPEAKPTAAGPAEPAPATET